MSEERDPFERVIDDADALHDAAMKTVPPDLKKVAGDVMDLVLRGTKAQPLIALAVAGALGFVIATMTSK